MGETNRDYVPMEQRVDVDTAEAKTRPFPVPHIGCVGTVRVDEQKIANDAMSNI